MGRSEVSTSVVEWSEGLRRYTCIDQMKFAAYMTVSFITFFHFLLALFCIIVCTVYVLYAYV